MTINTSHSSSSFFRSLWLIAACCLASTASATSATWFKDQTDGVAFSYPSAWKKIDQRTGQYRIMVGGENSLGAHCVLTTKTFPELALQTDADAIQATTARDIEAVARQRGYEIKIISFKQTKIGNRPAILYEEDTIYQSLEKKMPVRSLIGMVKVKDKLHELRCSAHPEVAKVLRDIHLGVIGSLLIRE